MQPSTVVFKPVLNFSEIFSRTFKVISGNILAFSIIALIVIIPFSVFYYIYFADADPSISMFMLSYAFSALHMGIIQAILGYGTFLALRNEPVDITACFWRVLKRMPAIILTSLTVFLLFMLASLLLVIPGIFFLVSSYLAIPLCVIEGSGTAISLDRSSQLMKGYRWYVFSLFMLMAVITVAATMLFMYLPQSFWPLSIVIATALSLFDGVSRTVLYAMLRYLKEGPHAAPRPVNMPQA